MRPVRSRTASSSGRPGANDSAAYAVISDVAVAIAACRHDEPRMGRLHGEVDDWIAEEVLAAREHGRRRLDVELVLVHALRRGGPRREVGLVVAEQYRLSVHVLGAMHDPVPR